MSEFMDYYKSMLVIMCRIEALCIYTEHASKFILSNFPDMEVFDFAFSISLYLCLDLLHNSIVCSSVYENSRSISKEKISPTEDKD